MNNTYYNARLAINKSLLKEYSNNEYLRIVYMKDNSEFQIQFFNPYSYTIGIDIYLNDKSLGNLLVLKPGERIWLERYFDDNRKFRFSTYEVENSVEAKKAIANNGNIKIKFYKESSPTPLNWSSKTYFYEYPRTFNKLDNSQLTKYTTTCNATTGTTTFANYFTSMTDTVPLNASIATSASTIETGRIEKGSYSDQNFSNICMDFESFPFRTETIKILPYSQKPLHKFDLAKRYCSNCGRKINPKHKFCPYCGTKV